MAATGGLHHPMNRVAEARCAIIGIERDWETGKVTFLTTEYALINVASAGTGNSGKPPLLSPGKFWGRWQSYSVPGNTVSAILFPENFGINPFVSGCGWVEPIRAHAPTPGVPNYPRRCPGRRCAARRSLDGADISLIGSSRTGRFSHRLFRISYVHPDRQRGSNCARP